MGCSQYSKLGPNNEIVLKQNTIQLIKTESNNQTMSATNLLVKLSSSKVSKISSKPCTKIFLTKQFNSFILEDLTGFPEFSRKLYNIRKFWILFKAARNYFESEIHKVCFSDYKIEKGLLIMIISVVASSDLSAVCVSQSSPYLTFKGKFNEETSKIIDAWNEVSKLLSVISEGNIDCKIESYVRILDDHLEECEEGEKKYLKKAILAADEFVQDYREVNDGVKTFLTTFKTAKNEIIFYASQVQSMKKYSGKFIVHQVLGVNI